MGIRGKAKQYSEIDHLRKPKIEHVADCADCGAKSVLNRRVVHTWIQNPYSHWRSKCNCGCFQNPITGAWEKTNALTLSKDIRLLRQK